MLTSLSHSFLEMNIDQLEKDLQKLIQSDKTYHLRDAAKKRAVEQRVPSYEHFE